MSLNDIKIKTKAIQKTAEDLISHFDKKAKVEVVEKNDSPCINIETEISALLIGRRGETLDALQYLLRLIVAEEAEEFVPLSVDVGGYRATQEQNIIDQALAAAGKVKTFETIETLNPMNAYERRLVHLALEDLEGISAESEGDEPYRRIVIKPRKK